MKYLKTEDLRLKTPCELCIKADEVMADVRSAAWLEQELHPELDRHRRHEMADICERDNVERVWRVLGLAEAEIRQALRRILRPQQDIRTVNELDRPDEWIFSFLFELPSDTVAYIREKIHEYMVASVMSERGSVIIPQCAGIWKERAAMALAELRGLAASVRPPFRKVRRPLVF